jgi:hypothetical protein
VLCEPDVALLPDHEPDAVQAVAFVLLHVNVDAAPDATLVGDAPSVTVGAGNIDTDVLRVTDPPAPVHVSENVVFAFSAPVLWLPDVALLPDQPPDAVQLLALVVLHVSVDAEPAATLAGDADNVSVGAGNTATATVCATVPPLPVQLSV